MNVHITTLIENSPGQNQTLHTEHGLSFFIKTGDKTTLFDTGASSWFAANAERLKLDLTRVENVILSHGHYDHSGGYPHFVSEGFNPKAKLWVRSGFFDKKFGLKQNTTQYLGNAFTKEDLEAKGVAVQEIQDPVVEIAPSLFSVSGFASSFPLEQTNPRFTVLRGGNEVVDDFSDEQAVVIKSAKGLVVILGCSHPGVITILTTIKARFQEAIYAVIGGTHLVEADQRRIEKTMDTLLEWEIPLIGISHCSGGPDHIAYMKSRLGERFFHNNTGTQFEISN
ncbi:MAG: MBL fold metallo-hydrolase [Desulfobacterales bacterium]|nr:MBL fold metallo-hydrolase [Desulfobacterales bacterium]